MPKYDSINGNWKEVVVTVEDVEIEVPKQEEVVEKPKVTEPNLDLNNDGKVDSKDASIASKVMNEVKKKKKSRNKK